MTRKKSHLFNSFEVGKQLVQHQGWCNWTGYLLLQLITWAHPSAQPCSGPPTNAGREGHKGFSLQGEWYHDFWGSNIITLMVIGDALSSQQAYRPSSKSVTPFTVWLQLCFLYLCTEGEGWPQKEHPLASNTWSSSQDWDAQCIAPFIT